MNFQEKSAELYLKGYSCSEAIVIGASECNIVKNIDKKLLTSMASSFSGGMGGTGCLCGALAGAQIILGTAKGRKDINLDPHNIKNLSKQLAEKFKEKRKATCCRILTAKYKDNPKEKRQNCTLIVKDVAGILDDILKENP